MIWKSKKLSVCFYSLALLLSVGLSTLLTNPAQAYEIATPVNPTGNAWEWGNSTVWNTTFIPNLNTAPYYTKRQNAAAIFIQKNGATDATGKFVLNSVESSNPVTFKTGNYYSTIINFSLQGGNVTNKGNSFPSVNRINLPNNAPYKVMSISSSYVPCADTSNLTGYCTYGGVSWNIIVQATRDATGTFQLGLPNTDMFEWILVNLETNNMGTILVEPITEFEAIKGADTINQQQQEAGEQAQSDGNTAGSSSQQQAQQGGSTLLQGFSDFVGALTSASASNCVINGDIGDFKMGNMDLCQLNPPPAFQAISSIMVIGFVVPLSIATIRKFIGMFRSFQNG